MLLALAILLIHPQVAPADTLTADNTAMDSSAPVATLTSSATTETASITTTISMNTVAETTSNAAEALPDAPVPAPAPLIATPPVALGRNRKPLKISVDQLQAEYHRNQLLWRGLTIATSGAATFDAYSTRRAITKYGAVELDPLLKPFAGNASLYAAIQVAPALLDLAGKKMMYSRHSWVRRVWWVPQSASIVSSVFCGAHNLSYR